MKTSTCQWSADGGWDELPVARPDSAEPGSTLVLAFCDPSVGDDAAPLRELAERLPGAVIVGCSTAGQISGSVVSDIAVLVTIIYFDSTTATAVLVDIPGIQESAAAGEQLGRDLMAGADSTPAAVLVLSDGLVVNGTDLVAGMTRALPEGVAVSGGLAGDGARFARTWVTVNGEIHTDAVVAVGLWGDDIRIGHGSAGGWQPFGPVRRISKSAGSVLLELDGQPALSLYKSYLGDKAEQLPASALLFPLRVASPDGQHDLVRTVLSVDEDNESMQFAGDIPAGWDAQLMRTTVDRLIEGASNAAETSRIGGEPGMPAANGTLALAVSCVGRRLVMGSRTEEEAEACLEALGAGAVLTGFYSYGEISPVDGYASLHNQTMTLTTLTETPAA